MTALGVNIDHVATLRQARYRSGPGAISGYGEPDVVPAASAAIRGGADCLTLHLREDRRHIIDRDVELVRRESTVKFNLEMAGTPEMQRIALGQRVEQVTIVPEGRQEVTTEGGLAVAGRIDDWRRYLAPLKAAGIVTSAFITPDLAQANAAADAGFDAIELHTGNFALAFATGEGLDEAAGAIVECIERSSKRLRIHAGHALNYDNTPAFLGLQQVREHVRELHIGHSIVSRAVFVGLESAVGEMKNLIRAHSNA